MTMKRLTGTLALLFGAALALRVHAAPWLIAANAVKAGKTTFSFFYIDPAKVSLATATARSTLQTRLNAAGEGITACFLAADLNASNINCGNGLMNLGPDYFSYHNITYHPVPTIPWTQADADSGLDNTTVEYGVNARSVTLVSQPTESTRVFQIRFNRRVAQFGFHVDPFIQTDTPDLTEGRLVDGVQFVVNGQVTPVHDLTQTLRGTTPFVGVEDPHGFTEVTVIATGGGSIQADRYIVLPLSNF
jgi:hypothetical protein